MSDEEPVIEKEVGIAQAPGEIRQEDRRVENVTIIPEHDADFMEEAELDELEPFLSGEKQAKIKVTLSTQEEEKGAVDFAKALELLIPNCEYHPREGEPFNLTRSRAYEEGFTDLLTLIPHENTVYSMIHVHLPNGPCAHWRLTKIKLPEEIGGHPKNLPTSYPEIILKRFSTSLGKQCGRMLKALFPANPQLEGRRVVTFHQQRDFVFCRSYQYLFESQDKVKTVELGPRFTLRLLWMQEGPYNPSSGQYTFYRRIRNDTTRRTWWL